MSALISNIKNKENQHHRYFPRKVRHAIICYCREYGLDIPKQLDEKIKIEVEKHNDFHKKCYNECFITKDQKISYKQQRKKCNCCDFNDICFCRLPISKKDQEVIDLYLEISKNPPHCLEKNRESFRFFVLMSCFIKQFASTRHQDRA